MCRGDRGTWSLCNGEVSALSFFSSVCMYKNLRVCLRCLYFSLSFSFLDDQHPHIRTQRRPKSDLTFEALGATDELNACIGLAKEYAK